MWAITVGAAACVVVAVLVGMRFAKMPRADHEQAIDSHRAPAVNRATAPEMRSIAPMRVAAARRARRGRGVRRQRLPKQDLFPTPQPLSPEVQALVQYAASAPENERQALVQAQAQMNAPLKITPLRIAPLNDSSKDGD